MKSSYVSLRSLVLKTLAVMVFITAPTWAELTSQQFGQAFKTASQKNDGWPGPSVGIMPLHPWAIAIWAGT
jgi:hypothetical protein